MTIGRICSRDIETASPHESIRTVAQRMGNRGVGTLIVTDDARHATGILTDRDVTVRVVGSQRDPDATLVADVMTEVVHSVDADASIDDALRRMRTEAVRRLVVVGRDGELVGIVSLDDVLTHVAREFREVQGLLEREDPRQVFSAP